jgi:hypothetical protein
MEFLDFNLKNEIFNLTNVFTIFHLAFNDPCSIHSCVFHPDALQLIVAAGDKVLVSFEILS